ncbi:MAG: RNA methyltransferase, partial [Microlunatus sp.]|nr:RNA methyltransferase [Microlunatus sp.]
MKNEPTRLAPASAGQLRSARRLLRRKERLARGEFLAEGPQAVREALAADRPPQLVLITERAAEGHADLVSRAAASGVRCSMITDQELATVTDATTPQGIVAIC